ncbi:MAG: ABC transporter ATP-binding protein/permease [Oscillospiraceae bacterium]|nr:ABC transporter ATP-binding protein/permease [Oscillospiraceae bacterium]
MSNENNTSYDVMDMSGEGMSTEKAKNSKQMLKRMLGALKPQRWKLVAAFMFAIAGVILNLRAPLIFADAINTIFEGMGPAMMGLGPMDINFTQLGEFVVLLIGIYLLGSAFTYVQERIMASVSQKLVLSLRERVSAKLAKVPLKFYDTHKKGEILSRVTNDLERVNEVMQSAIMRLFTSAITIIGALILMFRINWILTLIALGAIFVGLIITALVGMKSSGYFAARQKSLGVFNTRIEEYFSGQVEIKAFTLEQETKEKTFAATDQLYKDDKKAQFIMFAIMPIIRLFNQAGYVAIAALGASFVISGRISIGQIMSFFQYIQMSQEPLTEASYVLNSLQAAIASAERVFEVLDEAEDVKDQTPTRRIESPKGSIVFEDVQFGYDEALLMKGVNFAAKPGQKIAIVGPTGAGKTTLVNLLMRFYELRGGAIKVDGIDIREFDRHYLRSLFGMVLQDSWIFDGTIAENIAYGRHRAARSEVVEAAKMARADYFIRTLPAGYDTVMNDENATLSQGEKQLLCIARAILANPPMLLLDEATSSVDTRTEVHIQKAMDTLMQGRTSFIIAHRLSTIKNADMILVMDNGDIVEAGSHGELLERGGMYSEIYNSQFVS